MEAVTLRISKTQLEIVAEIIADRQGQTDRTAVLREAVALGLPLIRRKA